MFVTALFTIPKIWKQLKCLSTDEWIKKMCCFTQWNIYSDITKNEIMPSVVTWKDLEIIILSEVSQSRRQVLYDNTYGGI